MPADAVFYARMWTKVDDTWGFIDSTFHTIEPASLTSPSAEFEGIPNSLRFTWNEVVGAEAYYLYIGTAKGTKDIVDTGQLGTTYRDVDNLPVDSTVHVRLHTLIDGHWKFRDFRFRALGVATELKTPTDGAEDVAPRLRFEWAKLFGASKYYLYVGTTRGATDVSNSGEITDTSWPSAVMTGGQTYYVRIYTKTKGIWYQRDYSFRVGEAARLLQPIASGSKVDPGIRFSWNPALRAQAYYLYVGSSPGGRDFIDTGERTRTDYLGPPLPGGVAAYARLWTKIDGTWHSEDSTFITRPVPRFATPLAGATNIGDTVDLTWNRVAGARGYRVIVGTAPGRSDVLAQTEVPADESSIRLEQLPAAPALYARVFALLPIGESFGDVLFSPGAPSEPARILAPFDGIPLNAGEPIRWEPAPLARGYRLVIGTTPGGHEVLDTGEIQVHQRFVENVPTNVPLYASLTTYYIASGFRARNFTFIKSTNGMPDALKLDVVRTSVARVRESAPGDVPSPYTVLSTTMLARRALLANCADFSNALIAELTQIGVGVTVHTRDGCLTPNAFDCHTFVEILEPQTGRWLVLDPTFGLIPHRAADGAYATAEEVSESTRSQQWTDIRYEPVTSARFAYADAYYVDYPLLFFHLFGPKTFALIGDELSVLHFYDELTFPHVQEAAAAFAIRCPPETAEMDILVEGEWMNMPCLGVDNMTPMVWGSKFDVDVTAGGYTPVLLKPKRFEFVAP